MQHRVSHDEVEAVVLEGQLGSLAAAGLDVELEPRGRLGELREHARGDVARHRPLDDACSHQVEREVTRSGPDLERARKARRL